MEFHLRVRILEIMFKGTVIKMKNYNTDEIETIIKDLEENMGNLMDDGKRHLDESEAIRRDLDNRTKFEFSNTQVTHTICA